MDQTDPWQVVPRQVFTPYDCVLISIAFVVLCRVGCLWVTGVHLCMESFYFSPKSTNSSFLLKCFAPSL